MSERLTRFEGFRDSVRARMTDALAQELTALWNRDGDAEAEPERLAAMLETWRGRLRRVARDKVGPAAASFVGRTAELGQLVDLARQAGSGRAGLAVVAGEPGVGKTRLLTEFAERARRDLDAHVLSGSCVKLGDGVMPYAPLVDSLRTLVWEKGPELVRRSVGPAWNDLADLVSDAAVPGVAAAATAADRPDVGVPGRLRIFSAVRRMLEHLGTTAPVVLVFEDLHWADQSTLDLVSYLTHTMAGERTLLACSHRSALPAGHRLRTLLTEPGFRPRVTNLELPRFSEAELAAFLDEFASLDRQAVRRYHEVTEGNAFFAEQLVISGVLSDSVEEPVPRSVTELTLTRLAALSSAARRVLRIVSTARRVDDRLLEIVGGLDGADLDDALDECRVHGMLVTDAVDGRYVVPHALLSAAVYKEMAPRERRHLHSELARALAAGAGGALAQDWGVTVEVAYHWYRARRHPEALVSAVRAGETTMRVRGFPEAASHYRRALSLWDQVAEPEETTHSSREQILVALADAARWSGHAGQAVEHIQEAVEAAGPHANPRRLGELYERLGSYQQEARAVSDDGHAYAEAVRLLAKAAPNEAVYARALSGLAMAEVRAGSYDTALDRAQEAVVLAHDCGDAGAENTALNAAGVALAVSGRTAESEPVLRRALDVADRADRLEDVLRTYSNLARTLAFAGDTAESADQARAGLQRARAFGLEGTRLGNALAGNAGSSLMLLGHWNEATDLLNKALADRPHAENSARLRLTLAGIEVERGRFAQAEELIEELREQRITDPWFAAALHACEAELWCWRGQAVRAYGTALRGLEATDNVLMRMRLCAVGLRAAADHRLGQPAGRGVGRAAGLAADGGGPVGRAAVGGVLVGGVLAGRAVAGGDLLDIAVEDAATLPETAVVQLLLRQCEAEFHRAAGTDSAEQWGLVAAGWDGVERPYPAAYARWRQAAAGAREGDGEAAAGGGSGSGAGSESGLGIGTGASSGSSSRSGSGLGSGSVPMAAALQAMEAAARLGAEPLRAEAARLVEHMRAVAAGSGDGASTEAAPALGIASLTPREADVLRLLATGCSNREIGSRFHLAEGTVATHVHRLMRKLGVQNRTEAALWAVKHGLGSRGD